MTRPALTLASLTVLALLVGPVQSATRVPARALEQGDIILAANGMSLNQAISMVEKRFKARVVRSDVRQDGNRKIYVLRLLDDSGRGQVVRVDAATGSIL